MKRFWKEAAAANANGGWSVELDGKPMRTPARRPLVVPTESLANGIAAEWNSAGERVSPRDMPLTGLANAAIDQVAPDPKGFAAGIAKYGEGDLLCYRADSPRALLERQEQSWDSLLAWGRRRFDVDFQTTCAIVHVPQAEATVRRLARAVAALDPFRLAALSVLVTIGGSLVVGLGVVEGAIAPEHGWEAVTIDERWQREKWGEDAEAEAALEFRRRDFFSAAEFVTLLD